MSLEKGVLPKFDEICRVFEKKYSMQIQDVTDDLLIQLILNNRSKEYLEFILHSSLRAYQVNPSNQVYEMEVLQKRLIADIILCSQTLFPENHRAQVMTFSLAKAPMIGNQQPNSKIMLIPNNIMVELLKKVTP